MAQYLRDAIIRAVSQALSKYVEGVTTESAQLSIREGRLEFKEARLREGVVPPNVPLQLLSGELSLSLKVPWRNLGQDPVVAKVSKLDIKLEPAKIPTTEDERGQLLTRWRDQRSAAVNAKAKALAAADAAGKQDAGMIARLVKTAISNVEVQLDAFLLELRVKEQVLQVGANARLHTTKELVTNGATNNSNNRNHNNNNNNKQLTNSPMDEPNFEGGTGAGKTQGTAAVVGSTYTSFEIKDISVDLKKHSSSSTGTRLIGPLSLKMGIKQSSAGVKVDVSLVNTAFTGALNQLPGLVGIAGRLARTAKLLSKQFPKELDMKLSSPGDSDSDTGSDEGWMDLDNSDNSDDEDNFRRFSIHLDDNSESDSDSDGSSVTPNESKLMEETYTRLLLDKLRGQKINAEEAEQLQEIEDTTPIEWQAWHLYVAEKQIEESRKEKRPWYASLFRQAEGKLEEAQTEQGVMAEIKALYKDLPEGTDPETVEVSFTVPTVSFELTDDTPHNDNDGDIRGNITARARGLDVKGTLKTVGGLREVTLRAELMDIHAMYHDRDLFYLGSGFIADADQELFLDIPGSAVDLDVRCQEEMEDGMKVWNMAVNLLAPPCEDEAVTAQADARRVAAGSILGRTFPCEIYLAPWTVRRFLDLLLEAVRSFKEANPDTPAAINRHRSGSVSVRKSLAAAPNVDRLKSRTSTAADSMQVTRMRTQTQGMICGTKTAADVMVEATKEASLPIKKKLSLCVSVSAPVLHWELPSGDFASFRLGKLQAYTLRRGCDISETEIGESLELDELDVLADLTEMCVTVFQLPKSGRVRYMNNRRRRMEGGTQHIIFQQPAMTARYTQEDGCPKADVIMSDIHLNIGNELWRFAGQVRPTMEWALEPVTKVNGGIVKSTSTQKGPAAGSKVSPMVETLTNLRKSAVRSTRKMMRQMSTVKLGGGRKARSLSQVLRDDDEDEGGGGGDGSSPVALPAVQPRSAPATMTPSRDGGDDKERNAAHTDGVLAAFLGLRPPAKLQSEEKAADSKTASTNGNAPSPTSPEAPAKKTARFADAAPHSALKHHGSNGSSAGGGHGTSNAQPSLLRFESALSEMEDEPSPQKQRSGNNKKGFSLSLSLNGVHVVAGEGGSGVEVTAQGLAVEKEGPVVKLLLQSLTLNVVNPDKPALSLITVEGGEEQEPSKLVISKADWETWLKLSSRPITVDWRPACASTILDVAKAAQEAWQEAQTRIESILVVEEEGKGAIEESWMRWKKAQVGQLFKDVKKLRKSSSDPTRGLSFLEPLEGLHIQERLPAVAEGEIVNISLDVHLDRVQLNLWPMPGITTAESPCVKAELDSVGLSVSLYKCWITRGFVNLRSFEVHVFDRLILAPRHREVVAPSSPVAPTNGAVRTEWKTRLGSGSDTELCPRPDEKHLLEVGFLIGEQTIVCANGEQLSLFFRMRDLDYILAYVHAQILDTIADFRELSPPPSTDEPEPKPEESPVDSGDEKDDDKPKGGGILYSLDIGCPVVFLPTFKAVTSGNAAEALDVTKGGSLNIQGEVQDTEDTYSMFDFGHLQLWNNRGKEEEEIPASVEVKFRGTVVKSTATGRDRFVAQPSTDCMTKVTILNRRVELSSTGHYCMDVIRREATQWLDVIAENVLYKGFGLEPPESWPTSERKVLRDKQLLEAAQRAASAAQSQGFVLQWCWEELDIDTAFTDAVPLSHIELCDGKAVMMVGGSTGFSIELQAHRFALDDRRTGSRNTDRRFIRCGQSGKRRSLGSSRGSNRESSGFFSAPSSPTEIRRFATGFSSPVASQSGRHRSTTQTEPSLYVHYGQRKAIIRIREAITMVLPQLLLDQQTWGLSCWRLCTWSVEGQKKAAEEEARRAANAEPEEELAIGDGQSEHSAGLSASEPPPPPIVIQVALESGAFRLSTEFEDPKAEYLEIRGSLYVKVTLGPKLQLDIDLVDGRFLRSKSESLICPAIQLRFLSQIQALRSETGGILTDFRFDLVMPPTRLQLTGLDLGILTSSFGQLGRKDADSMEPREELELRDPDAFRGDRGMHLVGALNFQGLRLLLADDRRGALPALCVEVRCVPLELDLRTQENRPSCWCFQCEPEALSVDVKSFHGRLGLWEPVLPDWRLGFSFRQELAEHQLASTGRAALKRELRLASERALTAVVTTSCLRLLAWFLPLFSAHLASKTNDDSGFESPLKILNLSGVPCVVSCGAASQTVECSAEPVPLDELLRPSEDSAPNVSPQASRDLGARSESNLSSHDPSAMLAGKSRASATTCPSSGANGGLDIVEGLQDEDQVVEVAAEGFSKHSVELARESLALIEGRMVCEVLVSHPSRRLLVLSSAAFLENNCQVPLEIRFMDRMGNTAIDLKGVETVDANLIREATKQTTEQQQSMPRTGTSSNMHPTPSGNTTDDEVRSSISFPGQTSVELGPGQGVFVPYAALHGTGKQPNIQLQIRPAGPTHAWTPRRAIGESTHESGPIELKSEGLDGDNQTIFLDCMTRSTDQLTTLRMVLWTRSLANAMPCKMECRVLGEESKILSTAHFGELPLPANCAQFQLRLETKVGWTDWSQWLRWQSDELTEEFAVTFASTKSVALILQRDPQGRRPVIHAPFWFTDTTGLGAKVMVEGNEGLEFDWDDATVCLMPPVVTPGQNNFQFDLTLGGEDHPPVTTSVPTLGAPTSVLLPPSYQAVLRTDRISAAETFGVHCRLICLLPKYVLFNRTKRPIAFCQEGCSYIQTLAPGENTMFFFESVGRQRLHFSALGSAAPPAAPMPMSSSASSASHPRVTNPTGLEDLSARPPSFELDDHTIGTYPMATPQGPVCLKLSREGGVLSATVDREGCHELHNEHKSLIAELRPDGNLEASTLACPGQVKTFGCPNPFEQGSLADLFLTRLGSETRTGSCMERVKLDLRRRDRFALRVGGLPVTVSVAAVQGVAIVTIQPRLWQEPVVERLDFNINLKRISVALVAEAPRREQFGIHIDGIKLGVGKDNDEDLKSWAVEVERLQVDRLHPTSEVLLASVQAPFLKWGILREDCNASQSTLSGGDLMVGNLEAAIDDATVQELTMFVREAVTEPPGLRLDQVWARSSSTYSKLASREPPDVPPTFVLRSLSVSSAKVTIWARLDMTNTFLPRALVWFVRVTGLGVRIFRLDGVVIKVPALRFFNYQTQFGCPNPPFVGSTRGLLTQIGKQYIPALVKCWQSVVSNSNIMFGGILSPGFWLPKSRVVTDVQPARCRIGSRGQVEAESEEEET